jgi:CRP-like cAMP-binding protein
MITESALHAQCNNFWPVTCQDDPGRATIVVDEGEMTTAKLTSPLKLLQEHSRSFSALSERQLLQLEARGAVRLYSLEPDEALTLAGREGGESFHLLLGSAEYSVEGAETRQTNSNSSACRAIEVAPGQRVTFQALDAVLLCRADRSQVDYMTSWQTLLDAVGETSDSVAERLAHLRNPSIFMQLPFENVERALSSLQQLPVVAGETVIEQGAQGNLFYIIEAGTFEVWRQGAYDDAPGRAALLSVGDVFGYEALVSGDPRNATVVAVTDGSLLTLRKQDFNQLIRRELVDVVDAEQALGLVDAGSRYLDVGFEEEYYDLHLPDALLIPLPELRARLDELDRQQKYVVYCYSGSRSEVAVMLMRQHGIDAVSLDGGLRDWPYDAIEEMAP